MLSDSPLKEGGVEVTADVGGHFFVVSWGVGLAVEGVSSSMWGMLDELVEM